MNRIRLRLPVMLAGLALVAAGIGLGACSSGPVDYPTPTNYTVTYHGQIYCGYQYSEFEVSMYGYTGTCIRVAYPSISVVPMPGTLDFALATNRTTYADYLASGFWYDQVYSPIGGRYHIAVISRSSYLSNATIFQRTYAPQIRSNSAKAQWSSGKKGNYSFPSSNQNAKNKPLTNTGSNSGSSNFGTSNSRDRSGPATNTSGSKTGSGSSSTSSSGGKPGTRR